MNIKTMKTIEDNLNKKLENNKLPSDLTFSIVLFSPQNPNCKILFFWAREGESVYYKQSKSFSCIPDDLYDSYKKKIIPFLEKLSSC